MRIEREGVEKYGRRKEEKRAKERKYLAKIRGSATAEVFHARGEIAELFTAVSSSFFLLFFSCKQGPRPRMFSSRPRRSTAVAAPPRKSSRQFLSLFSSLFFFKGSGDETHPFQLS